jgi:hypothetical protein
MSVKFHGRAVGFSTPPPRATTRAHRSPKTGDCKNAIIGRGRRLHGWQRECCLSLGDRQDDGCSIPGSLDSVPHERLYPLQGVRTGSFARSPRSSSIGRTSSGATNHGRDIASLNMLVKRVGGSLATGPDLGAGCRDRHRAQHGHHPGAQGSGVQAAPGGCQDRRCLPSTRLPLLGDGPPEDEVLPAEVRGRHRTGRPLLDHLRQVPEDGSGHQQDRQVVHQAQPDLGPSFCEAVAQGLISGRGADGASRLDREKEGAT